MSSQRRAERRTRRAERKLAAQRAARRRQLYMLGGLVGIAVVAVVALVLINRPGQDTGGSNLGSNLPLATPAAARDPKIPVNGRTMGKQDAPVKVVEWGDYQ